MGGREMNKWELEWHIRDMQKSTKWIEKELTAFKQLGIPESNVNVKDLTADLNCLKLRIEMALRAILEMHN